MSGQDRNIPANDLDFAFMTTESAWGKEVSDELNEKLQELSIEYDENNNPMVSKKQLWGLLSYYTRDMRLSNLNNHLFEYCQVWLDIAGDCLRVNYIRTFLTALSRVITVLELAQSRGGFLRRRSNTMTQELYGKGITDEQKKKGLFGGFKKTK